MNVADNIDCSEVEYREDDGLKINITKEDFLDDLEYLADKASKYARSKSSINTHHRINQIRLKYGLDKRLL